MSLWSVTLIKVINPKEKNVKKILNNVLKEYEHSSEFYVEFSRGVVTYNKEYPSILVNIQSTWVVGESLHNLIMEIHKELNRHNLTHYVEVTRNFYFL